MYQTRTLLLPATILLFSLASSWPTTAAAQHYPLSYSGRIVDDKSEPRAGPVDLEFSFYDADQAGNRLGDSPYRRTVTLSEGVFQVTLELPADEAASIFANQDSVWIEVKDVGADKIYPRQRFTYVPYAMRVPVDGTTLGYDATTGQLKVISAPVTSVTAVNAGTGLTSSTSNGAVTLNVDVGTSANKIVQLDGSAKIAFGTLPVGMTANTVAAGNDTRLSDARTPTGTAGGDLSGTYPSPTLATNAIDSSKIANGSITSVDLADNAVTNDKLAGSITPAKIATDASNRFVTDANISSWTTAASWGNHANAGYLNAASWATPNAIGSTTPTAGTFTALQANSFLKLKDTDATANYVSLRAASAMATDVSYTLPAAPEAGKYLTTDANGMLTWNSPSGSGDMLKATYDSGNDGKVDTANNAEKLNNQSASYYTDASNLATGTVAYLRLPVGTGQNTIAAGDDTRFTNPRTPTGAASGDLSGTYPSPTIATDAVDSSKIANGSIVDADIASSAAIADSKLATISTANKVANSATTATNLNTNNAIVARDASGNFSAGTITANLTGNVTGTVTGNITGTAANVTGTVAVANGGTGATTAAAALNNLLPTQSGQSGKVLQTDGTNATWATMSTGSSSGTGGGAAANPSSGCPTGYVLVPGDTTYGTSDFCVMKYEAKFGNKGAESRATGLPARGTISQPVALASCRNLGPGYALINNSEWMTIAANIANRASNWSNNAVGNAALNRGHSDGTPGNALAAVTDDNDPCNGTGQTCNASTWNDQRRTHTLSNNNVIWDFAGNVCEWVDYNNYEDKPGTPTPAPASAEYTSVTGTTTMAKTALVPSAATKNWWNDSWNGASNGIGQYYAGANYSGGALLRGGGWSNGTSSGVFAAVLRSGPSLTFTGLGFRCVFRPPSP